MSSVPQDRRYAPPGAEVADVVAEGTFELAERGTRFGAAFIDGLIAGALIWGLAFFTRWSPLSMSHGYFSFSVGAAALGYALFLAVQGYTLATRGQTLGKMMLSIRIVRSNGERAAFGRLALLRYGVNSLTHIVPGIGQIYGIIDALLIFRQSRKCLHDNIADTIVVKA